MTKLTEEMAVVIEMANRIDQANTVGKLSEADIAAFLETLPEWKVQNGILTRTFQFADFVVAMKFVNAIADAAEKANHHPDIDIRYNKVTLGWFTHDANGITTTDFSLARHSNTFA
jgi:4a-hydroxytetrahydrobiopterin dehydratase